MMAAPALKWKTILLEFFPLDTPFPALTLPLAVFLFLSTSFFCRCETGEPVDTYSRRQLLGEESLTAFAGGGLGEVDDADEFALFLAEAAKEPFTQDLARGNVCVFFAGGPDEVKQMDVSVQSVLDFVPGVRIAVAADVGTLEVYQRCVRQFLSFPRTTDDWLRVYDVRTRCAQEGLH